MKKRIYRFSACLMSACLALPLFSCGRIARPAVEKIEEVSEDLGIDGPVHSVIEAAESVIPGLAPETAAAEEDEKDSADDAKAREENSGKADDAEAREEDSGNKDRDTAKGRADSTKVEADSAAGGEDTALIPVSRMSLRSAVPPYKASAGLTPSVPQYDPGADFANVMNRDQFGFEHLSDAAKAALAANHFYVENRDQRDGYPEFYELYEENRYWQIPNFVTVDSLMHTYHLYFTVLMRKVEREALVPALTDLSRAMLDMSFQLLDQLKGTSWENAARRNAAYFNIGLNLLDPVTANDTAVQQLVDTELEKIYAANAKAPCSLFGGSDSFYSGTHDEDYSQYKPRGNYEGDPVLEKYFRAMMWYGRITFLAEDEDATRSAALITACLNASTEARAAWEKIYTVSSFFAGTSDDLIYYDYSAAAEAAWPNGVSLQDLPADTAGFTAFREAIGKLEPPRINSLVHHPGAEQDDSGKGFRFMGQRYNMDSEIYERLTEWSADPAKNRVVPSALDVPNVLGSPAAEQLMQEKGDARIPVYAENLPLLREEIKKTDESVWKSSLYAGWLHTLTPLLTPRPEGYPAFAKTNAWLYKTLETYEGSYTELKHDTVLYAKQVYVAEGDGESPKDRDDRGYVEPEPEVYARFASLSQDTKDGLERFGMLSEENLSMLDGLTSLAAGLLSISEKELQNQSLTEEEYGLIRDYGTIIEKYWEAYKLDAYAGGLNSSTQLDASLVTDIASGDGWVLELGTGLAQKVVVLVPVEGSLRLASGTVYSFYEFLTQGQRLTDNEWKTLNGFRYGPDSTEPQPVEKPAWTLTYRVNPSNW